MARGSDARGRGGGWGGCGEGSGLRAGARLADRIYSSDKLSELLAICLNCNSPDNCLNCKQLKIRRFGSCCYVILQFGRVGIR
jgi:hypothetical protein